MLVAETVGSPQARSNGPGCGVSGVPVGPWLFLMTGGSPATWSLAAEQSGDPCREHCSSEWLDQAGRKSWLAVWPGLQPLLAPMPGTPNPILFHPFIILATLNLSSS